MIIYGFELEGFIVSHTMTGEHMRDINIYNATDLMNNFFGVNSPIIKSGVDYVSIFADGTALEATSNLCWNFQCPAALEQLKSTITNTCQKLFNGKHINFLASCRNNHQVSLHGKWCKFKFDNPGKRYSSQKVMCNAYTGKCWTEVKKEEDVEMSLRTAGFHCHLSFPEEFSKKIFVKIPDNDSHKSFNGIKLTKDNPNKHCDGIIKIMDEVFDLVFLHTLSPLENLREALYHNKGDYRIKSKNTISGKPTLEYRRISAEIANKKPELFKSFIEKVDNAVVKYLKTI